MAYYFDVHCHLAIYPNIKKIIKSSEKLSISIIAVSMDLIDNRKTLALAEEYENVFPMLALHPFSPISRSAPNLEDAKLVATLIEENLDKIVGVGEIGLDHYFLKDKSSYAIQNEVFNYFLDLAEKYQLGITVHGKNAEIEVFEQLKSRKIHPISIHWYSGPQDLINNGIRRGYYFSITPAVLYSAKHRIVVEKVPLEQLLTESDGPVNYKIKNKSITGEPIHVVDVVSEIAKIKNLETEKVKQKLYLNARKIYEKSTL
ncbi:MAG: TatD family hydrolase [Candidatus Helarchaeota archaeon]|nr:TatD family hydrolase [Candidatus Helarchaeota archaeon]